MAINFFLGLEHRFLQTLLPQKLTQSSCRHTSCITVSGEHLSSLRSTRSDSEAGLITICRTKLTKTVSQMKVQARSSSIGTRILIPTVNSLKNSVRQKETVRFLSPIKPTTTSLTCSIHTQTPIWSTKPSSSALVLMTLKRI